jgi:Protein kinase domain
VVGRYEILREIGHGGTAVVYLARQTDLGRLVALKELSLPRGSDTSAARRFVRESRLAGGLNHPNVVTVHDFFERNGTPYIAMEYLERGSLRPLMRDLGLARVAGVLQGLLAGLGHAHARGIVHRDLKPENVMVTHEGMVKIADFGIAKATGETLMATQLTATGTTIGTPAYMSPEQALGQDIGPATDLYALGVIAFEMFAGEAPFGARDTPAAVLLRHVNEPPPQLVTIDEGIDPRLSGWVDRLLEKDPRDRPPTALDAWIELEEVVIDQLGSRWRRSAPLPEAPLAVTPETMPLAYVPVTGATPVQPPPVPASGLATTLPPAGIAALSAAAGAAETAPLQRRRESPPPRRRRPPASGIRVWRLARAAVLLAALVAALAAALGGRSGGGDPDRGATPARATVTATPARTAAPSGVGDSQSDDPSDDEPDVGEP